MGMSVIPVREAVSQLQSEGFVEHRSGVGSFVPAPSYEELLEIYELRELIESNAAAKATQLMSEIELAELTKCVGESAELLERFERWSIKARRRLARSMEQNGRKVPRHYYAGSRKSTCR